MKNETGLEQKSNEELFCEFYYTVVTMVHEENSKRGSTKKTQQREDNVFAELSKRFDVDIEKLEALIYKV